MSTTETPHPGATLAALRTEAGMSQRQLAKVLGVPFSHLSRVESGERALTDNLYREAARAVARHISGSAA